MFATTEKRERSLGMKLGLKPHRCLSPKCVGVRRPHRPGVHGKARRQMSEFALQLQEKQRLRAVYGIREAYLEKLFREALTHRGVTGAALLGFLERRLDNAVYRLGFAPSRSTSRELVSHGHIDVGGRRVDIPSYRVKPGDVISIHPTSREHPAFRDLKARLEKYTPPSWLSVNPEALHGIVKAAPGAHDLDVLFDTGLVVDYYGK